MVSTKTVLIALGLVFGLSACGQNPQTPTTSARIATATHGAPAQGERKAPVIKPAGEMSPSLLLEPSTPWPSMRGLHKLMAMNQSKVRRCFLVAQAREGTVQGRMSVEFVIDNSGAILDARVGRSTLGNKKVESCIVSVVRGIRFPAIPNGSPITVRYPFATKKPRPKNESWLAPSTELAYFESL